MTNEEKRIKLAKELHNQCNNLTRADISYANDWETMMPNVFDDLEFERDETLYLDKVIEQWIESYWDTDKELTEEDEIKLYEWALKPETKKACKI